MNPPAQRSRWIIRGAGAAGVLVFLLLVARFWHPVFGFTAFLQLDATNDDFKIAAFHEQPVYVYRNTGGYDGLYYAQIAYHPTLTSSELAPAIDSLGYRARRILPPALAWILAAGNPAIIVHVYSLLNVVAWLVLAFLLWQLLAVSDARGLLAWSGVLFSAGALASVRFALTDLIALTFIAGAMFAAERGRTRWAGGTLAAAALSRETSLLAVVVLWNRPWFSRKNLYLGLIVAAPLAAWMIYVRVTVANVDPGLGNFNWPFVGFIAKWRATLDQLNSADARYSWPTLLVLLGLTVQGLFFLVRRDDRNASWRLGAVYVALMFCLGWIVWVGFPGAAARVLLPLTFAFNLHAARTRASWAWLVLGNLTVVSGILTLAEVPEDPREIAAARTTGIACVATAGDGWYGREQASHHRWSWCKGNGQVSFEAWPKADANVGLELELASPIPRTVVIKQDGRELWRGAVESRRHRESINVTLHEGRASLEFSSAAAPLHEDAAAGGRDLAFALYDARLVVTKP